MSQKERLHVLLWVGSDATADRIIQTRDMSATSLTMERVRETHCAAIIARCESAVCFRFAAHGKPAAYRLADHVPCRMDLQKNGQNRNHDCAGAGAGGVDRRDVEP